ncbi:MAG: hypothetical protein ACXW0L_04195, partial [Methylosarcina sp.]
MKKSNGFLRVAVELQNARTQKKPPQIKNAAAFSLGLGLLVFQIFVQVVNCQFFSQACFFDGRLFHDLIQGFWHAAFAFSKNLF